MVQSKQELEVGVHSTYLCICWYIINNLLFNMHGMNVKVILNIGLLFLHTSSDDLLSRWRLKFMLMVYICMYKIQFFIYLFVICNSVVL